MAAGTPPHLHAVVREVYGSHGGIILDVIKDLCSTLKSRRAHVVAILHRQCGTEVNPALMPFGAAVV